MAAPLNPCDIPDLLRPGMRVFVQGSTGLPSALLRILNDAADRLGGLEFVSPLLPGVNAPELSAGTAPSPFTTFFDYPMLRQSWQAGPIAYVPSHYSEIAALLRAGGQIDIALVHVAGRGADGRYSLGVSADFVPDILPLCRTVIAQVNQAMPSVMDGPSLASGQIDYIVEVDDPLPQIEVAQADDVTGRIAEHAAALIRDGDTIQFGVGKIPQAVVATLRDKRDLGLHNGLTTAVVRPLIESGVMNGNRKSRDSNRHVTGALCGDADFYRWFAGRDDVALRPVSYTHAHAVLSEIDNLAAINSALEVDLYGQANAEMAGTRQISGSGGLVDFVRGARASRGGRALICLPATSGGGKRSNIVPRLGGVSTVARTDIDIVVTEYGAAHLRHLPVDARAEALVAIAAPEFREGLANSWTGGSPP